MVEDLILVVGAVVVGAYCVTWGRKNAREEFAKEFTKKIST